MRKYLREVRSFYEFIADNFSLYKQKESRTGEKMKDLGTIGNIRAKKNKRTKLKQSKVSS